MATKIELETKQQIIDSWDQFQAYRRGTESHRVRGRLLNESDVRAVLERLLTDVLGYDPAQIDREPDHADFVILYRGMKLVVIETKDWGVFRNQNNLDAALLQASTYANRHQVKHIIAFDAQTLVLADSTPSSIDIKVEARIDTEHPAPELFHFTHYGLSSVGKEVVRSISVEGESTLPPGNKEEYKPHHGVRLHYSCYAYVGDLRAKATWRLPYRNPDYSVDTGRIDKAVSYLFRPGGYRGVTAKESSIPEAAQPEVARKLAIAYREIGKWGPDSPSKSVKVLWDYLASRGETDLH